MDSTQVTFNAASSSVSVILNQDNVALESDETFILELDSTGTLGREIFIMDTINITIVDSDGKSQIQCCKKLVPRKFLCKMLTSYQSMKIFSLTHYTLSFKDSVGACL